MKDMNDNVKQVPALPVELKHLNAPTFQPSDAPFFPSHNNALVLF